MYGGKRVGVAIATYNGEKFIQEQLLSIIHQTVVPDEILVSDDGSSDRTLDVVGSLSKEALQMGIDIKIRADNPRHGVGGNFEWAITHCYCDYIFVCGQDDVWLPDKVAKVLETFESYPQALMVCHDLGLIDAHGRSLGSEKYHHVLRSLSTLEGEVKKISRVPYLEASVSAPLIAGPAICICKELVGRCMPIPLDYAEDQWLQFCATAEGGLYFLNQALTKYRLHNSATRSVGISRVERIKKMLFRVRNANRTRDELVRFSCAAIEYINNLDAKYEELEAACVAAKHIYEIGCKELEAKRSGRIIGAYKLTKLFLTDMRYRKKGTKAFLVNILNILLYSKKRRCKELSAE